MLSGAVSWDVLEEQLANTRTSGDKIRQKIFDFAHDVLGSWQRAVAEAQQPKDRVWISSTSASCSSAGQDSMLGGGGGVESALRDTHRSWVVNTKRSRESKPWHWETVSTLRAVLDMSTHLCNYPLPLDTALARFVVARQDLYIPRDSIASVLTAWPGTCVLQTVFTASGMNCLPAGCEVGYVEGGHVSATVMQQRVFR